MKVLAIDTSNFTLGIALINDTQVIGEYTTNLKKNHSVRVMPAIETLLRDCDTSPKELTKIVVAQGPGSYTGVRIGVTIAKTLAWTLKIPLSAVSSLEVLAANGRYFNGLVSPLFDARRGQIYTGLYEIENNVLNTVMEDCNILSSEWAIRLKELKRPVLFVGQDVEIHREAITKVLGNLAAFSPVQLFNSRPSELAFIGLNKNEVDIHQFVPNYIRMAEAEAKWLEQQGK
ncbi:tRNA (adenosine(37)-N6)-threonylcarbamoyltransferase complex dimerization subunit type 1 TsaB [Peribacillus butanolivorans]|uniref:tRNA (adenosine(37)-N6)-threonylcarbamoyltransferase complex dimerization subunit type 1 TsaB n=1 Tax=Peribacillus TaxID=2675229 RepID=UPI0019136439|nr:MULTISPECIES: tRNA (adenosine(37)-N6)-threonylcarbamoyltransferase complex dimerization subunit type 1 TsaB [unclassified Peribacillus]MBK5444537.1 tRNA (adenosine(37)-N6)-threonylcarbamoyltransferase complex dimerization subunit type 1 TsaB [Peribacillus sp. TH24]MBK5460758.1 tRNA (adenosine(37)-N6)-threonylcarbamoyltransferase complex dimerization subunit type 1 TsaB [Peribacillus sp. TH27]MBK5485927.1 tRNA (adenosine(37)-N6)-threonylcarbamoyltransferase complex dimerization subunit type 1 